MAVSRRRPTARSARGSPHRSSTARSARVSELPSAAPTVGINAAASARIRVLCSPMRAVSRATARTRRSSVARAAPGSSTGSSDSGATNGSRASVSASIPLVLACRDRNRRRSAAFAEDTRTTRCPRRPKNTAIGSHAGPVGSTTTSSRVPGSAPCNAATSSTLRLSTVGTADRRARTWPSPSTTTPR